MSDRLETRINVPSINALYRSSIQLSDRERNVTTCGGAAVKSAFHNVSGFLSINQSLPIEGER